MEWSHDLTVPEIVHPFLTGVNMLELGSLGIAFAKDPCSFIVHLQGLAAKPDIWGPLL